MSLNVSTFGLQKLLQHRRGPLGRTVYLALIRLSFRIIMFMIIVMRHSFTLGEHLG